MNSITLAVNDAEHVVPGIDVAAAGHLFWAHDTTVRAWIAKHQARGAVVVIAKPEWIDPGDGAESLTFPVGERDAKIMAGIWERVGSLAEQKS